MDNLSFNDIFSSDEKELKRIYDNVINGIRTFFDNVGGKKAVLGLSGGLDSSICAVLLAKALGEKNVYAISMPSKISSQGGKDDARILAQNLNINYLVSPIANDFELLRLSLDEVFYNINADRNENSTTLENLQARMRATILWSVANEFKSMFPIATSDKSEAYIGYATVNGDMTGAIAPIADIRKTTLFKLGEYINNTDGLIIPQTILEKPPGAELKINEKTGKTVTAEEDNMPYLFLDEIIYYLENENFLKSDFYSHSFVYETQNLISQEQKQEWIDKFFRKARAAVFKWNIFPPTILNSQNSLFADKGKIIDKIYK